MVLKEKLGDGWAPGRGLRAGGVWFYNGCEIAEKNNKMVQFGKQVPWLNRSP